MKEMIENEQRQDKIDKANKWQVFKVLIEKFMIQNERKQ
jgi:hypothetical protein